MKRFALVLAFFLAAPLALLAQAPDIPFDSVPNAIKLQDGMYLGEVSGIAVNSKGHIFLFSRGNTTGPAYSAAAAQLLEFDKDGKFVREWGKKGSGEGDFDIPHGLAMDSLGRLFVADRNNNRIQIFTQDGDFIDQWTQFGRPSGIFIDKKDVLYVADSESNSMRHPGWQRGIRIGSAKDGKVTAFIPDPNSDPNMATTSAAEGVAADSKGDIYGAEVGPMTVKKYVKQ